MAFNIPMQYDVASSYDGTVKIIPKFPLGICKSSDLDQKCSELYSSLAGQNVVDVHIPTKEECELLPNKLRKCGAAYWTSVNTLDRGVLYVGNNGKTCNPNARMGFRPIIVQETMDFNMKFHRFFSAAPGKRLLISHNDLDGVSCATIVNEINSRCKTGKQIETAFLGSPCKVVDYLNYHESELTDYHIMITDIGYDQIDTTVKTLIMNKRVRSIICVDHHQSVMEDLPDWAYINNSYSATKLLYELAIGELSANGEENPVLIKPDDRLDHFVSAVSDYDTGNWGDWTPGFYESTSAALEANLIFHAIPYNPGFEFWIENGINCVNHIPFNGDELTHIENATREEFAILAHEYRLVERSMLTHIVEIPDLPESVLVGYIPFNPVNYGVIAKKYLENDPDIDILASLCQKHGTISLRTTRDNINVAALARRYGGGGHPKAAGFPLNRYDSGIKFNTNTMSIETSLRVDEA